MKKFTGVICCLFIIIVCFSGCNRDIHSDVNGRYELKAIENGFHLIIDGDVIESFESMTDIGTNLVASIQFDSIEEFINTVKNGKLDDHQLAIANRCFKKDSSGAILTCDFSKIRVPVCPNEFNCRAVYWSGELYSYQLESANGEYAHYHYLSKEKYEEQYVNDYLNFFSRDTVTLEKTVDGNEATEYYYSTARGEFRTVRYSVTNGNTLLYVDETYCLRIEENSLPTSDSIPLEVTIYGSDSEGYFSVSVFELKNKPTLEWLKNFGIKMYK